ncbi:MAG: DUF2299 family protein [Halobacteria archaeon]|nr:DUF2299 family protein [Halobacteria archaeon]
MSTIDSDSSDAEVRDTVERWLTEEAIEHDEVDDEHSVFNFSVRMGEFNLHVLKTNEGSDKIDIVSRLVLDEEQQETVAGLDERQTTELRTKLEGFLFQKRGTFEYGGDFESLDYIDVSRIIYHDALDKDRFVNDLIETRKTVEFTNTTVFRYVDLIE